jgi:hypothetical protein
MKKLIIFTTIALLSISMQAQTVSVDNLISEDQSFRNRIDSIGIDETKATHDDSYLKGKIPMIFGNDGDYYFQLFSTKSDRANFYYNSLKKMCDVTEHYRRSIRTMKFDSLETHSYTSDLGDCVETYIFYKNGIKIRLIQVTFLEGIQFQSWDDETYEVKN